MRPNRGHIKAHILLWTADLNDDSATAPVLTSPLDGGIGALEGFHCEHGLTAYHNRLADIQRCELFSACKTITDIIPGTLARP
jgi:hypothetical protein